MSEKWYLTTHNIEFGLKTVTGNKSVYKMKSSKPNINKHEDWYSEKQINLMKEQLKDYLYCFGYVKMPGT